MHHVCGLRAAARPRGNRDIGLALKSRIAPGDRVVYVESFHFDVAFHATLADPPLIVSDWADPALARSDTWRKELHDAAERFGTPAQRNVLWPRQRETDVLCHSATVWRVAPNAEVARVAGWPGVERVQPASRRRCCAPRRGAAARPAAALRASGGPVTRTVPLLVRYAAVGAVATVAHDALLVACVEAAGVPAWLGSALGAGLGAQVASAAGRSPSATTARWRRPGCASSSPRSPGRCSAARS